MTIDQATVPAVLVAVAALLALSTPAPASPPSQARAPAQPHAQPQTQAPDVRLVLAASAEPGAGDTLCTVANKQLRELSGLVAVDGGYVAINDSNDDASKMRIFYLDSQCRLTRSVKYPQPAKDPEDLALGPDGSLWVADTGDNREAKTHRDTIAVWRLSSGATTPVVHRLRYPDGHHDCEALLIDRGGLPVLITKEVFGSASVYKPTQPLAAQSTEGVPLSKVGRFSPRLTRTSNPFGLPGHYAVTGAGIAPDRSKIVVRTYSDAYEFAVPDGDIVKALTSGKPRVTPLPKEPQGESIAYTPDGTAFLTVSDEDRDTALLRYTPTDQDPDGDASPDAAPSDVDSPTPQTSPTRMATPRGSNRFGSGPRMLGIVLAALGLFGVLALMMRRR